MKTIGGNVRIWRGNELDFGWKEAVQSLLPFCDVVSVCFMRSMDGSLDELIKWAKHERRLRIVHRPFVHPRDDQPEWSVNYLNYAREHLGTDYHVQLDADEVFCERCEDIIRRAAEKNKVLYCRRFNFVYDPWHLIPEHHVCGFMCIRCAPTRMWMPLDCPHPNAQEIMGAAQESELEIFHYGFLRKRDVLLNKFKQRYTTPEYQEKLRVVEDKMASGADGLVSFWEQCGELWADAPLGEFNGEHPALGKQWLESHGFDLKRKAAQ